MRRNPRTACWPGGWLLASLLCAASHARVARADEVRVQLAPESCPDAALLEQKLGPLLPDRTLVIAPEPVAPAPGAAAAAVHDRGERYVIEVAGLSREVDDPARDCTERARVAAVFIALNLGAKLEPAPPAPAPPPAPPTESEAAPEPAAERPGLQLGLRLLGDAAYAPAPELGALGGSAGAWIGYDALRFALSLGALSPARVSFAPEPGAASLMRLPLQASAEYVLELGPVELGPALGLVLDVLRLRGQSLARPQTELRLNPGLALAADLGLRLSSRVVLRLRAQGTGFARAYDLRVEPLGSQARTPRLWLGASLGLDIRLH